ncbi:MAG: MBOAT family O-acyltransferase [Limisphaerales bacterium]
MLFNSDTFLRFFLGFLLLYCLCRNHLQVRNWLIVAASWLFYGWWDYRFLFLLILTSTVDYWVGIGLDRTQNPAWRKGLVGVTVVSNLALLGFFKYFDFFAQSFAALLDNFNVRVRPHTLGIILPIGISFYTFQSMGYIIEVYRGQFKASRELVQFWAFVSFFPHLVAGPIQRAGTLLPQFGQTRRITRARLEEGVWLIIWGMFKKVVVADNLAPLVEMAYQNPAPSGALVALGTVAFAFQIYGDFSGYSDIARGTAKVIGFDIMFNFNLPYCAENVREFWQRWNISLSSWLRDYLYISLGGNRRGRTRTHLNLLITMLLGGLWHGASLNFVLWGLWHGAGLIAHRLWSETLGTLCRLPNVLSWMLTMGFVLYGWLLFRGGSIDTIYSLTTSLRHFTASAALPGYGINLMAFTLPVIAVQMWQKRAGDLLAPIHCPLWLKVSLQGILLFGTLVYWQREGSPFIYFQF